MNANERQVPRRATKTELAKAGVQMLGIVGGSIHMQCGTCATEYYAIKNNANGTRRPRGYWICPNGCNRPAEVNPVTLETIDAVARAEAETRAGVAGAAGV